MIFMILVNYYDPSCTSGLNFFEQFNFKNSSMENVIEKFFNRVQLKFFRHVFRNWSKFICVNSCRAAALFN